MKVSDELRERLTVLLEAERAGVVVAKKMLAESGSGKETALLETVLRGEKDGCQALGKALLDLGFTGSGRIGDFVQKVMALPDKEDRMQLLVKGQEWVVRKIDEVLGEELPEPDRVSIEQVRRDHVTNIEKCRQFLAQEKAI